MKRVVIIGAGGHAREVAEILRACSHDTAVLGFVDDQPELEGKIINGLPILGGWSWFHSADMAEVAVICAVGSPEARRNLALRATESGLSFCNAVSPLAYVSPNARIGQGVMVFPNAVISTDCALGDHTIINVASTVSHDTELGSFSTLNPGVHVAGNVSIGEGCYLGVGASVIHGISVGAWSMVGGGAIVTGDLPANVTAVGVPAKVIKSNKKT